MASCAQACDDSAFLNANTDYCTGNDLLQPDMRAGLEDDPICPSLVSANAGVPSGEPAVGTEGAMEAGTAEAAPATNEQDTGRSEYPSTEQEKTAADAGVGEDCSQLERLSQRILCENQKNQTSPSCARNMPELESDARLLVTEVRQELAQYGELLDLDLTSVESRELLCAFSLEDLDAHYARATKDPEALRTIQRRADFLQQCRAEWETYLREEAVSNEVSDRLSDQIARDTRKQFEPLQAQLRTLSSSITRLEQASGAIGGLIRFHISVCDPAGTPIEE